MKAIAIAGALALGAAALSGCGAPQDAGEGAQGDAARIAILHRGNGAEPGTLDPHTAGGQWTSQILADMFEGLYAYDQEGVPQLALGESVRVSADGLTWTFTVRADRAWSDGEPITSADIVAGLRRTLDPATLNEYAAVLYPIKDAARVNSGEIPPDALGVSAPDPRTVVINLEHAAPFLPEILAHAWASPIPAHTVAEYGKAWSRAENIVVSGPYALAEWRTSDFVRLVKNDRHPAADSLCFDEVYYYPTTDEGAAARRFRSGELDLNTAFPPPQRALIEDEIPGSTRVYESWTTWWLLTNARGAPFDDERVRRALGMAVDRDFVANAVMEGFAKPGERVSPHTLAGTTAAPRVDYLDTPVAVRVADARGLLEEAGFGPDNPLRFALAHPSASVFQRVMPAVQADLQAIADWVQVDLETVEAQAHYSNLAVGRFEAAFAGWAADYNDAKNFMKLFSSNVGGLNHSGWTDPAFDALLTAADAEPDATARAALLAEAEQMALDAAAVSPVFHHMNRAIVSPELTGWSDNPGRMHPSRYLCRAAPADTGDETR